MYTPARAIIDRYLMRSDACLSGLLFVRRIEANRRACVLNGISVAHCKLGRRREATSSGSARHLTLETTFPYAEPLLNASCTACRTRIKQGRFSLSPHNLEHLLEGDQAQALHSALRDGPTAAVEQEVHPFSWSFDLVTTWNLTASAKVSAKEVPLTVVPTGQTGRTTCATISLNQVRAPPLTHTLPYPGSLAAHLYLSYDSCSMLAVTSCTSMNGYYINACTARPCS